MNSIELAQEEAEPVKWFAAGLLRNGLHGLGAGSSVGKSTWLKDMATSAVLGEPLFGHYPVPRPMTVLMCTTEEEPADIARELSVQFDARGANLSDRLHIYPEFPPADGGGVELLTQLIEDLAPDIVTMDMFGDFIGGIPSNYNSARPKIKFWTDFAKKLEICLIGTVHAYRKGIRVTGPNWLDDFQGSVAAVGAMTVRLGLARIPDCSQSVLRVTGKGGIKEHDLVMDFDPDWDRYRASDVTVESLRDGTLTLKRKLVLEVLAKYPRGIGAVDLTEACRRHAIANYPELDADRIRYDPMRQLLHQMQLNPLLPIVRKDGLYFPKGEK
jgi:hypothetical protein